jgi:hypothetical protein
LEDEDEEEGNVRPTSRVKPARVGKAKKKYNDDDDIDFSTFAL